MKNKNPPGLNTVRVFNLIATMKIYEILATSESKSGIDFDFLEDLIYFMDNDPEFYRQEWHHFLDKVHRHLKKNKTISSKAFKPMVIKAFNAYQNKFDIPELDKEFHKVCHSICDKLHSRTVKHFHDECEKSKNK